MIGCENKSTSHIIGMIYLKRSAYYELWCAQTRSDLELFATHFHLVIVLLLLQLDDSLVITGYDARESRYNINQQLLAQCSVQNLASTGGKRGPGQKVKCESQKELEK